MLLLGIVARGFVLIGLFCGKCFGLGADYVDKAVEHLEFRKKIQDDGADRAVRGHVNALVDKGIKRAVAKRPCGQIHPHGIMGEIDDPRNPVEKKPRGVNEQGAQNNVKRNFFREFSCKAHQPDRGERKNVVE